ncbi:MAG TPA: recombinase RecA [bacterium]|nr:recombinase RecA [bacterium]
MADEKALEAVLRQIAKQYGEGTIMRFGDSPVTETEAISTGSLSLDCALGVGGLPRGRITEIYGAEASGKTTLALHVVASSQARGGVCAYVDAENALDPVYAKRLGVDIDNLLISQPDTGEQALEIVDMLVKSGAVETVVVDSVAALVPKAELEGDMGDTHMGLQARLMSQAMRKLSGNISRSKTCAVFINQIREKIGVMFGNPNTTPGGRALKFASSVRLEVARIENLKKGTDVIGCRTRVKVVKNKFAPPFRKAEFDIIFGQGICPYGDLLDIALGEDIVQQKGSWFLYGEDRIGQGRERAREVLKENRDMFEEIRDKARVKLGMKPLLPEPAQAKESKKPKKEDS